MKKKPGIPVKKKKPDLVDFGLATGLIRRKKKTRKPKDPKKALRTAGAEDLEGMSEAAYNRFADGSRAESRTIIVDPDTRSAILRAFP